MERKDRWHVLIFDYFDITKHVSMDSMLHILSMT